MVKAKADRPANQTEELTPAMIEAGVECFWDMAEDRFSITYDAKSFVAKIYAKMETVRRK